MILEQVGAKTNYHYVLKYGADRTILVKHEPFNYKFQAPVVPPSFVYLSSIGPNTENYHDEIANYLEANPEVKLTFQPGTFQMKLGKEKLSRIYARTEIFVCNVEESQRILNSKETDVKILMAEIRKLGPKIVCITDGPKGAYASNGENDYFMPIYPDPKEPVSRTGAGDAFASTFTSAIALGKSIEEALSWAPINSMNVVQYVGAQKGLLTREQLEEYLSKAPEDYKVRKI
jgi:ribokinase